MHWVHLRVAWRWCMPLVFESGMCMENALHLQSRVLEYVLGDLPSPARAHRQSLRPYDAIYSHRQSLTRRQQHPQRIPQARDMVAPARPPSNLNRARDDDCLCFFTAQPLSQHIAQTQACGSARRSVCSDSHERCVRLDATGEGGSGAVAVTSLS